MLYEIEQAVFERFPGYARMVVVAEGVDTPGKSLSWPNCWPSVRKACA